MKSIYKLCSIVVVVSLSFAAHAGSTDELLKEFVQCSPKFFEQVTNNKKEYSQYANIESKGKNSHFVVSDRKNEEKSFVTFKTPMKIGELTAIGFLDSEADLSSMGIGKYYTWGFVFDNVPKQIIANTKNIAWENVEPNLYVANPQKISSVVTSNLIWQKNDSAIMGVPPEKGGAEKVLMIENYKENYYLVVCSVQGEVTEKLLRQERPDF